MNDSERQPTRRELRENASGSADLVPGTADLVPGTADLVPGTADLVDGATEPAPETAAAPAKKRRGLKITLWIAIPLLLILAAGAAFAAALLPKVFQVRDTLSAAMPIAKALPGQMMTGEVEAAQASADQLQIAAAEAVAPTRSTLWQVGEYVPVLGDNLRAVRVAVESVEELADYSAAAVPVLQLDSLKPHDGAFDLAAIEGLSDVLSDGFSVVGNVKTQLDAVNTQVLLPQVGEAFTTLDEAITGLYETLVIAEPVVDVLPGMLGANGPRNYLLLFQNNAEARGTGGNPAAIALITVTDGRIELAQQASSSDFDNHRTAPIIPLDPETEALYGDKIGRWMQDVTLTPDFTETADLIRAYWEEAFGTTVDAVASFDPVALSYLLAATGPVELEFGGQITADNAVPRLLNEVYSDYPDPAVQDIFFAAAAGSIFDSLLGESPDVRALIDALMRAVDEGRLMFAPTDPAEAALIEGSRLSGDLPDVNDKHTVMGVYVNDISEGKLNYYTSLDLAVSTTQCQVPDAAEFVSRAIFVNSLPVAAVPDLAPYISPGRFFPKGHVSTDLVFYGPVGAHATSVQVNGAEVGFTELPHLGRPAVKVNVLTPPETAAEVVVSFAGAQTPLGPLQVWHTPGVWYTPIAIDAPGCAWSEAATPK